MIARYSLPEMRELWGEGKIYERWLRVEIAAACAQARAGLIPKEDACQIAGAKVLPAKIEELEQATKHDVHAFIEHVAAQIGEAARSLHFGLTSSDVLDTSLSLALKEASEIILRSLFQLMEEVRQISFKYQKTLMVGRTHGMHAEPITLGLKFALWYAELERNRERLLQAKKAICVGKFSGSVGTYAYFPPAVEEMACQELGLEADVISTQVIQRDRHAYFISVLALLGATLEKIALELRHLQRTEVSEIAEGFVKGQAGSSSMPHKKNPISSENICGCARLLRSYLTASYENISLWHERDISHSSVERVILPDACTLLHYMLERMREVLAHLMVDQGRMKGNLELTRGLIYSQRVMLEMMKKGCPRIESYRSIQQAAEKVVLSGKHLRDVLESEEGVLLWLTKEEIRRAFDPLQYTEHVQHIFTKVFDRNLERSR